MRFSEARFYLVAAGLHAALPVMALVAPAPMLQMLGAPIEVEVEVEIEPTPAPEPRVEAPAARTETPRSEDPRTETPARVERPSTVVDTRVAPVPSSTPTTEPQASASPTTAPAPGSTSEYDGPPPAVPNGPVMTALPGMGGQAWAVPGVLPEMGRPAPAPTTSPKATIDTQAATKVLTAAIKEKDKALGLDLPAGGTVATSVKSAVQAVDTPPESRATFEVRLSPTGQVLSVRVTSSSGGSSESWARAAKTAQATLSGKTLAMTSSFANGAVVYVNVQSLLTLPDGSKSAIEQKGAGASFDVTTIGAHMQRVVRTSFSVVASK